MKSDAILPVRVLTHNIRYATPAPFEGEVPWADRKQLLVNELIYNTRHVGESFINLQEVLHVQMEDILAGLNNSNTGDEWAYIGVGRDDGEKRGEYSPIFYRPQTWQLRHWETVWLSETPEKPSKSWDAASVRIVTIGVFRHRATGHTVLVLNTHLDDQGSRSRKEAAHIMLRKVDEYLNGSYGETFSGVILTGDFNSQENQEAYQVMTSADSPLVDSQKVTEEAKRYGNEITWTGFAAPKEEPKRIDYVLLGPVGTKNPSTLQQGAIDLPWGSLGYAVLPNQYDDGVFISDHRAVVVDAVLGRE